jgi:hypothetical protein
MWLLLLLGLAAACHPMCRWVCDDPVCNAVCAFACSEPVCQLDPPCGRKPTCSLRCLTGTCENDTCPQCEVVCDPSPCPGSQALCEAVDCAWRCHKPACRQPVCELTCEQPACGATKRHVVVVE